MNTQAKAHIFFTIMVIIGGVISEVGIGMTIGGVIAFNLAMLPSFAVENEKKKEKKKM